MLKALCRRKQPHPRACTLTHTYRHARARKSTHAHTQARTGKARPGYLQPPTPANLQLMRQNTHNLRTQHTHTDIRTHTQGARVHSHTRRATHTHEHAHRHAQARRGQAPTARLTVRDKTRMESLRRKSGSWRLHTLALTRYCHYQYCMVYGI